MFRLPTFTNKVSTLCCVSLSLTFLVLFDVLPESLKPMRVKHSISTVSSYPLPQPSASVFGTPHTTQPSGTLLQLVQLSSTCTWLQSCYTKVVFAGSHTGDRKLDDNAWNWWPLSSTVVVYGQVLVALVSQFGLRSSFGGHVKFVFVKCGAHGCEAEVAIWVLGLGK